MWCVGVLSRFIHLIENPQYAGGGARRGPTAGVQVKNLNYMFHVDSGHHTLDIDNTSTWTKHCYSNHHSHSLSHVVVVIQSYNFWQSSVNVLREVLKTFGTMAWRRSWCATMMANTYNR